MSQAKSILKGIIHGKTIDLEADSGLPDGQQVEVILYPANRTPKLPPGEGIRRSAGGWADDPEGLKEYLKQNRLQRKTGRPEIDL